MREQINSIINQTAARYNVRAEDLLGKSRRGYISAARQEAMYLVHSQFPGLSYESVAATFNRRQHGTVLFAIAEHKKRSVKVMTAAHLGI
jgi:chromosomal replication initiation ATPase DnaA